jgi:protein phosphatase
MRLRAGAATDIGRVRRLNEDAYMLRAADGLFVVCDGMGGAPAGEVASQMAIDAITRQLDASRLAVGGAGRPGDGSAAYLPHTRRLVDALRQSNAVVYDQSQRSGECAGMGTTVVGAWIREHVAGVAHVGDSRAYLWRDGCLEPLTRDHSLLEAQLSAGLVESAAGMPPEQAGALVRVLGREPDVDVDVSEVPVQPGDYVLLCSDGLTRMVPDAELAAAFRPLEHPQAICDRLVAAANRHGGADNVTVVVIHVAASWWRRLLDWRTRTEKRGDDVEADLAV